jgi:ribonuclease HII
MIGKRVTRQPNQRDILKPHLDFELAFVQQGYVLIAGVDEVGRGALAGPVMAGAVLLPIDQLNLLDILDGVRDSKLCTPPERNELYDRIREIALAAEVGAATHAEIDQMGIGPATRVAMRRAIEQLQHTPQALLIDWVRLHEVKLPQVSIIKGDQRSLSIAAASILAKVTRDRLMVELDVNYPGYGFARHKGYCTPGHQIALEKLGPCDIHRRSFDPIRARLIDTE